MFGDIGLDFFREFGVVETKLRDVAGYADACEGGGAVVGFTVDQGLDAL